MECLLTAFPRGARDRDEHGRLPLHLAATKKAPYEVVETLLQAYPEGVQERNDNGNLPLHCALSRVQPDWEVPGSRQRKGNAKGEAR